MIGRNFLKFLIFVLILEEFLVVFFKVVFVVVRFFVFDRLVKVLLVKVFFFFERWKSIY